MLRLHLSSQTRGRPRAESPAGPPVSERGPRGGRALGGFALSSVAFFAHT